MILGFVICLLLQCHDSDYTAASLVCANETEAGCVVVFLDAVRNLYLIEIPQLDLMDSELHGIVCYL